MQLRMRSQIGQALQRHRGELDDEAIDPGGDGSVELARREHGMVVERVEHP